MGSLPGGGRHSFFGGRQCVGRVLLAPLFPLPLGMIGFLLTFMVFYKWVFDPLGELCQFIFKVVLARKEAARQNWKRWLDEDLNSRPNRWLKAHLVPLAPFLVCSPKQTPVVADDRLLLERTVPLHKRTGMIVGIARAPVYDGVHIRLGCYLLIVSPGVLPVYLFKWRPGQILSLVVLELTSVDSGIRMVAIWPWAHLKASGKLLVRLYGVLILFLGYAVGSVAHLIFGNFKLRYVNTPIAGRFPTGIWGKGVMARDTASSRLTMSTDGFGRDLRPSVGWIIPCLGLASILTVRLLLVWSWRERVALIRSEGNCCSFQDFQEVPGRTDFSLELERAKG